MDFYQVQSQILPLVINVEFSVRTFFSFGVDVIFDSSGDIRGADPLCFRALFFVPSAFLRRLGWFWPTHRRARREESAKSHHDHKRLDHMNPPVLLRLLCLVDHL